MNTKLYVGNLPYDVTDDALKAHFEEIGKVTDVHIVIDKYTDQPRGFAFVTMEEHDKMEAAIEQLDGKSFGGRDLKINEARPREPRDNNRGGGGGGGYGGGGGGNYRDGNKSGGGSRKGDRGNKSW